MSAADRELLELRPRYFCIDSKGMRAEHDRFKEDEKWREAAIRLRLLDKTGNEMTDQDDVPESERDPKLQRMVWLFILIYCVAILAGAYCKLTGVF